MTGSSAFLEFCVHFALLILSISFVVTIVRIVIGPTLPDRILALDMLVAVGIGFIAAIGIKTRYFLYVDIAIALGLVGFLATVAFARFVLSKASTYGRTEDIGEDPADPSVHVPVESADETREPAK